MSKDRLALTIEKLRYLKKIKNQTEFGEIIGYGKSYLSELISGKKPISKGLANTIETKFAIDTEWLLTGNGEMFIKNETIVEKPKEPNKKKVPLYDAEAIGGNEYIAEMTAVTAPEKYIELGEMLSADSQAAMYVFGSSMTPNYPSGCIIGLRQKFDGIIQPGEVYVVETESNRYFKRLYNTDDCTSYIAYSDNTMPFETGARKGKLMYEPFDIPKDKIRRLFDVTGVIKRNQNSFILNNGKN